MKNSPDSMDSEEENFNAAPINANPKGAQGAQTARYDPNKNFFNKT